MVAPEFPLATPWSESTIPLAHAVNEMPIDPAAYRQARLGAMKMFAEEKVSAVLIASEKEFGLLNMSSQSRDYQAALVPVAYSVREDYEMLWHLQEAGHAEAEVSIAGSFSGKPVQVYNTVAEIRGAEKPDEVVIIGAHLDSWDSDPRRWAPRPAGSSGARSCARAGTDHRSMVDDQPGPAHRALGGSGRWVPRECGALVHQPRPRLAGRCRRRSGHFARPSTESVPGNGLEPYELAVLDHRSGFVMMYRRARYSSRSVRMMRS